MAGCRYSAIHDRSRRAGFLGKAVQNAKLDQLKAPVVEHPHTDIARRFDHLRDCALSNADCFGELWLSAFAPQEIGQLDLFHDDFSIRISSRY